MDTKDHNGTTVFTIIMRWVKHTHSFQMYHASTDHLLYDLVELKGLAWLRRNVLIFLIRLLCDRGFFDCISLNKIFPGVSKSENKKYTIMIKENVE